MSGFEIPLLIASSAAGAGIGAARQQSALRAAKRSARSTRESAQLQLNQNAQQAALERIRVRQRRRQAEGRLAVTAADAGVGTGETFDLLLDSLGTDAAISERIVDLNLTSRRRLLESGVRRQVQELEARTPNFLLSTLEGGLGGFQTGLSILQAGDFITAGSNKTPEPQDTTEL